MLHAVIREQLATRVLLLSAFTDSAVVFRALEEGAAGYLSKDAERQEIVDAVLSVARGDTVVPAPLAAGLAGEIRLRAQSRRLRSAHANGRCCRPSPAGCRSRRSPPSSSSSRAR